MMLSFSLLDLLRQLSDHYTRSATSKSCPCWYCSMLHSDSASVRGRNRRNKLPCHCQTSLRLPFRCSKHNKQPIPPSHHQEVCSNHPGRRRREGDLRRVSAAQRGKVFGQRRSQRLPTSTQGKTRAIEADLDRSFERIIVFDAVVRIRYLQYCRQRTGSPSSDSATSKLHCADTHLLLSSRICDCVSATIARNCHDMHE